MNSLLPSLVHTLRRWLELNGVDADAAYRRHGVVGAIEAAENDRIPFETVDALLSGILGQLPDSCAGLRAARCWHPSDLGALGYAWLASSTLRRALERLVRYEKVLGFTGRTSLETLPDGLKVVSDHARTGSEYRNLAVDYDMSVTLDMCRFNHGDSLKPERVRLQRQKPDFADRYRAFYGCRVEFAAREDSFTLRASDADRLLPSSNRRLAALHDRVLTQQLAALDRGDIVARCKAHIIENLAIGDASMEKVADSLHVSTRTLNRRLEALGATFARIFDDARRELAARYLRDPSQPIIEVAFQLGYSQQSSLARASQRWFGMSPREYRRQTVQHVLT